MAMAVIQITGTVAASHGVGPYPAAQHQDDTYHVGKLHQTEICRHLIVRVAAVAVVDANITGRSNNGENRPAQRINGAYCLHLVVFRSSRGDYSQICVRHVLFGFSSGRQPRYHGLPALLLAVNVP
jgi:hypothetical protein